jgi:hypothetical protein
LSVYPPGLCRSCTTEPPLKFVRMVWRILIPLLFCNDVNFYLCKKNVFFPFLE